MKRLSVLAIGLATSGMLVVGLAGPVGAGTNELELSKKEFLQQANATCDQAYIDLEAALREDLAGLEANDTPSQAQVEAAVASVVEILDGAATDVKALVGPPALEQKVDKFLKQFNAVVKRFEDDPKAAFEAELSGYPFKKPDKTAKKLGLKSCAQRQG
jgi:enamine deaminase RidA (YjgF/YER057c/UK114 family)